MVILRTVQFALEQYQSRQAPIAKYVHRFRLNEGPICIDRLAACPDVPCQLFGGWLIASAISRARRKNETGTFITFYNVYGAELDL
jgi:hypothetical protein